MNLTLKRKNGGVPSLFSDWLDSSSFFNPMFGDIDEMLLPRKIGVTMPSVNIRETEKDYVMELAAPGFDRKDFTVELENNLLTIAAEKKENKEEKDEAYSRREFSYTSFSRSFQLPENTTDDKVDARYENGILLLSIPKKEVQPLKHKKQIKVG